MKIDDIFDQFMPRHMAGFPLYPWPKPESEEWDALAANWKASIIRNGFRLDVLLEASSRLSEEEIGWEKHWPRLVKLAHEVCRERPASSGSAIPDSRAAAEYASRDCPEECGRTGFTSRYRHRAGPSPGRQNEAGYEQIFYCACPMGRWIEISHRANTPEIHARIPDLAKHPALRLREVGDGSLDNPHRHRPEHWDYASDVPILARPRTLAQLRKPTPEVTGPYEPTPLPPLPEPKWITSGAPAGLTRWQEIFFSLLGDRDGRTFNRLKPETRASWLDQFRTDFDQDTADAMIRNLATMTDADLIHA